MHLPGGQLVSKYLDIFFLCDCSGSMANGWLDKLNEAIRYILPEIEYIVSERPNISVNIGIIRFSSEAEWHISPTNLNGLNWRPLPYATGTTSLGAAYQLLAAHLQTVSHLPRTLPPLVLLFSDGKATDQTNSSLQTLMETPLAARGAYYGFGLGYGADTETLLHFVDNDSDHISFVNQAQELVQAVRHSTYQGISQLMETV